MSWNGMFKKFGSKGKGANTYPTTGDGERKLADQNETAHAENKRLRGDVKLLHGRLVQEYDRGYEVGYAKALSDAIEVIEERDGRVGKKQILAMVQNMLEENRKEG